MLREEELQEEVAGCQMNYFLEIYMVYISYKKDLLIKSEDTDEWVRFMISTKLDDDYKTETCMQINSGQENGYMNEPLLLSKSKVEQIIAYLRVIKQLM